MPTDTQAPTLEDPAVDHAADLEAIHQLIADIERSYNTNDAELGAARFAADALATTALGAEAAGREAIVAAHHAGYAGPLRDQFARYEVTDVRFPRPDVALVRKRATATDAEGTPLGVGHQMVALYVLVREAGTWWIAARQNTLVPDPTPS
jgi:uncharacterized protein (TIGR02246 family)